MSDQALPPIEPSEPLPARVGTFGPSDEQVLDWFYPKGLLHENVERLHRVREAYAAAAQTVLDLVPSCADRTAALRELAAASRSAVFALTHNQED